MIGRPLVCGEVCGALPTVGPGEDVIRHAILDLETGMGFSATLPLAADRALEFGADSRWGAAS